MQSRSARFLVVVVAALLIAALGLWAWRVLERGEPAPVPVPLQGSAPAAPAASAPAPASAASAEAFPIPADSAGPPLDIAGLPAAIDALLGRKPAASFVVLDEFPRRLVATVDNLGRAHAPALLWPTPPTPGRFTVNAEGGTPAIAADNAGRYTPFVLFVESLDVRPTVDLYVRMYPLLQSAYRQLGYPGRNFNDRLIEVIDLMLAAPEPAGPIRLHLTEVKGPVPSERPWVRYEFEDPRLQALPAGQKLMVRVGLENERRLKKRLAEFRKEIVARGQKR